MYGGLKFIQCNPLKATHPIAHQSGQSLLVPRRALAHVAGPKTEAAQTTLRSWVFCAVVFGCHELFMAQQRMLMSDLWKAVSDDLALIDPRY